MSSISLMVKSLTLRISALFHFLKRLLSKAFPNLFFGSLIAHFITEPGVILDVGCGEGSIIKLLNKYTSVLKSADTYLVGIDIFIPYLQKVKMLYDDVICCDVRSLPLRSDSADTTLLIELIEHLKKADGFQLLAKLEQITKRQLILSTPVGINPKSHLEDENPWQAHISAWYPKDFKQIGFEVYGVHGMRLIRKEHGEYMWEKIPPYLLYLVDFITRFITFRLVNAAFQMLCVKKVHPYEAKTH